MSNTDISLLKAKVLEAHTTGLETNPELYGDVEKVAELLAKPEFLTDLEVTEVGPRGEDNTRACSVRFESLREDGLVDVLTAEGQQFTTTDVATNKDVWGELLPHDANAEVQQNVAVDAVVELQVGGAAAGVALLVNFGALEAEELEAQLLARVKELVLGNITVTSEEGEVHANYSKLEDGITVRAEEGGYTAVVDSFALFGELSILDSTEVVIPEPEEGYEGHLPPVELGELV